MTPSAEPTRPGGPPVGPPIGAERRSRVAADPVATRLLFADLHNHSLHSDGRGDPEQAFAMLHAAGLDVAALTDHASTPPEIVGRLSAADYPDPLALAAGRIVPRSIDAAAWARTAEIADRHDEPGRFTALRGFEWTEPWLGHVNVWFSDSYTAVERPGRMSGLQEFLADTEPAALFGYNHPGREPGRLEEFALPRGRAGLDALPDRMVALEVFNRTVDFLFEGFARGCRSPVADCLDAGWRPGLIGCSDEHGVSYGLIGKGRTGLWAPEHSRAGVRACLEARHTYATREVGLRVDATLDGVPMGGAVRCDATARLRLDSGGSSYAGAPAVLQVLTSGGAPDVDGGVRVLGAEPVRVGEVAEIDVRVPAGTRWVVARLADPGRDLGTARPAVHADLGWALAYTSPWFLA